MLLNIDPKELAPIIAQTVTATLAAVQADQDKLGERLAFSEEEAAHLMGLEYHQLRDERQRGRISASSIVGRRIRYLKSDLLKYLSANRIESKA